MFSSILVLRLKENKMNNTIKKITSRFLLWLTKRELAEATLMDSKGHFVKPFNHLKCDNLDLEVVALALSRLMRFFGQTELSVAQHSVNMAKIFIHQGEIELAKQALLHEVSEAFMGDLASPLKKAFPMFKEIEESLIEKTFKCYNLDYPMDKRVHKLDKQIVINEAMVNMPYSDYWQSLGERVDTQLLIDAEVSMLPLDSKIAYEEFITTAKLLKLL